MVHSKGSPETEMHNNTGLTKKDRSISKKPPNTTSTRTGGTTTIKAQSKQKGENQDQSKTTQRLKEQFKESINPETCSLKRQTKLTSL